jgi:hypothetical protein
MRVFPAVGAGLVWLEERMEASGDQVPADFDHDAIVEAMNTLRARRRKSV